MLRQSLIEMLDRVELNPRPAVEPKPERQVEPAGKSGERHPAIAAMNAGSVSRFFATGPVWSREVGYFEVGPQRVTCC
ncbi:MAG: hypothetical protein FJ271_10650 [Planctomycetes bacterium]|nr:hypothetical protein [Planctomycetota bacterium]